KPALVWPAGGAAGRLAKRRLARRPISGLDGHAESVGAERRRGEGRRGWTAAVGLALAAAPPLPALPSSAPVAPYTGVPLDPGVQARIGVRTARLSSGRRSTQIDGFAKVLDPGPLAQLETDLEAAEASAAVSAAEARRARSLNAAGSAVAGKE